MKILIDQNISFRIIQRIESAFPNLLHVKSLGLMDTDDSKIFMYARRHDFDAILTIDEDFYNIQMTHGVPPKLIWLRLHNASVAIQAEVILNNTLAIYRFLESPDTDCLEIFA
jgi:predicted nuclease of predicted toxin-antitoxin system